MMVDDIYKTINRYEFLSKQIQEIKRIEAITKSANEELSGLLKEHTSIKKLLKSYYGALSEDSKQDVTTAEDILIRRKISRNEIDDDGNKIEIQRIHIGLDFLHDEFNNGNLFPKSTFMSMAAAQGVGKSDYLYRMANRLLVDGMKVLLLSFEFGEERLGNIIAPEEDGGKDRLRDARKKGMFGNLLVNYYSRDLQSLELLIDMAHTNGVDCILIDSFGEFNRGDGGEYTLQQDMAILLNKKVNDYGMFIVIIAQVNNTQIEGEYKIKGGNDFAYKPDFSIYIKKLFEEDTSGRRAVHLIKNREADLNGKTIVTKYDFDKREPIFDCMYEADIHGKDQNQYGRRRRKKQEEDPNHTQAEMEEKGKKASAWAKRRK